MNPSDKDEESNCNRQEPSEATKHFISKLQEGSPNQAPNNSTDGLGIPDLLPEVDVQSMVGRGRIQSQAIPPDCCTNPPVEF